MGLTKVELKGLNDGTDGQIITYDASGNPVAVGPGTDGQVLTSTGAGSPPAFEDSSGTTINNNADNRVITGSGTAGTLNGEANLTFDGEQLNVTHAGTTDPENQIVLQTSAIDTGGGSGIFFKSSSSTNANRYGSRIHTTRESGGASNLIFSTEITGGSTGLQEALKISPNKNVTVSDGDLVMGGTGHGINFAASQTNAAGMTSETLDSYEEGTWSPGLSFGGGTTGLTYTTQTGFYTKIGRLVQCGGTVIVDDVGSSTGAAKLTGLPFTIGNNDSATSMEGGGFITYWLNFGQNRPYHVLRGVHNSTTCDWMYGRDGGYTYSDSGAHSDFANDSSFRFILTYQT